MLWEQVDLLMENPKALTAVGHNNIYHQMLEPGTKDTRGNQKISYKSLLEEA
jgi:hypothetical protein